MYSLPPLLGALGLAAVFSAEISAADASLFMLTTSLAQDLYKRFINPGADDRRVLHVARWSAVVSGLGAAGIALVSESVLGTLRIFYTLLGVTLFVPIVAGLYTRRTSTGAVLVSIAAGVAAMLAAQIGTDGAGWGVLTPALAGLLAATTAWLIALAFGVR